MQTREHARARVTVDLVILTIRDGALHILLIKRGKAPYRGAFALPGGFVRTNEDLDKAAIRELLEETQLDARTFHIEQLRTYGAPDRDPRGRVVTVAYLAIVPNLPQPVGGTDAHSAHWVAVSEVGRLAFDHGRIVADALEVARTKLEYTTLAVSFCPKTFTISDLRKVYEAVWERELDARNFHRKVVASKGFVVDARRKRASAGGRPGAEYRAGRATTLYPPLLRGSY
jgi:8-oxo-dGTP diphosphatase